MTGLHFPVFDKTRTSHHEKQISHYIYTPRPAPSGATSPRSVLMAHAALYFPRVPFPKASRLPWVSRQAGRFERRSSAFFVKRTHKYMPPAFDETSCCEPACSVRPGSYSRVGWISLKSQEADRRVCRMRLAHTACQGGSGLCATRASLSSSADGLLNLCQRKRTVSAWSRSASPGLSTPRRWG